MKRIHNSHSFSDDSTTVKLADASKEVESEITYDSHSFSDDSTTVKLADASKEVEFE